MRVAEQGLSAVTVDAVAEQAGITKGGLLYHFPSRTALLSGVYEQLAADWATCRLPPTGSATPAGDRPGAGQTQP